MALSVVAGGLAFSGAAAAASASVNDATDVSADVSYTQQRVALDVTGSDNLTVGVSGAQNVQLTSVEASGFSYDSVVENDNGSITLVGVSNVDGTDEYLTLTHDTTNADTGSAQITVNGQNAQEFQLVDEDAVSAFADGGSTFWAGQGVYFGADQTGTYQIRQVDTGGDTDDIGTLVTEFSVGNDGVYVIDTAQASIETGQEYVITNGQGQIVNTNQLGQRTGLLDNTQQNLDTAAWSVQTQNLNAEWDEDEVSNEGGTQATQTFVELSSNRANYDVTVSANNLDEEDLETIFDGFEGQNVVSTNDDDGTVTLSFTDADGEVQADFTDVNADDYQFTFAGADTDAEATANVSVTEDEGGLSLDQGTVAQERGDVAEFTVSLDDTDTGYVEVGSDDTGYNVTLAVEDGGDGQVEVQMNTYEAGSDGTWAEGDGDGSLTVSDEQPVYSLTEDSEDDDDSVEVVGVHSDPLENPLEAGTYDLAVSADSVSVDGGEALAEADDIGTLDLQERGTEGVQMWAASGAADFDDREELLEVVNQSQEIAGGSDANVADYAVVQLQASGVYGQIDEDDLSTLDQPGLSLTIEEDNPGANQEAEELDLTQAGNVEAFYTDEDNNTAFVVVDTGQSFFDSDEEYTAQWELTVENPMITDDEDVDDDEEEETANASFDVVEPEVDFDNVNDEDQIEVASSQNATVSGTTNIAPGSDVTVRVRSDDSGTAFLRTVDTTVSEDGSFSAAVDMSGVETGTEFTVELRRSGRVVGDETDGVVVEAVQTETPGETGTPVETGTPDATGTPAETAAPGDTTTTTTAAGEDTTTTTTTTAAAGGDGGTTTTTQDTPGFGVVVALVALVAAALLAVRRDN